jgi:hypothetical protein
MCSKEELPERELGQEGLNCKEFVELLERAGLMKTIANTGRCYERLVKEFVVNLTTQCGEEESAFLYAILLLMNLHFHLCQIMVKRGSSSIMIG